MASAPDRDAAPHCAQPPLRRLLRNSCWKYRSTWLDHTHGRLLLTDERWVSLGGRRPQHTRSGPFPRLRGKLCRWEICFVKKFFELDDLIWVVRFQEFPTAKKKSRRALRSRWEFFYLSQQHLGKKRRRRPTTTTNPDDLSRKIPQKQNFRFAKTGISNSHERNSRLLSLALRRENLSKAGWARAGRKVASQEQG